MMPKAPMPMPGGMPTGAAPGGAPSASAPPQPEQVRAAIMTVLQRAKSLAESSGLNFEELVAELGGAGRASAPPPPMPGGMGGPPPGMMG
jgi:hypothetical protein